MKFYETHYEEYINACEEYNMHPELVSTYKMLPKNMDAFGNIIVYGPSGVGKYTQVLKMIKQYSPSLLKYDKKIKVNTDKQTYCYRISDIHYEVDMSLLGCNSKILWHELFLQIIDIVSMKPEKRGFIICKNFHTIHNELLEIFYSYIQQYNYSESIIQIRFIIITEHISFLPNNILNCCKVLSIKRPSKIEYLNSILHKKDDIVPVNDKLNNNEFMQKIIQIKKSIPKENLDKIQAIINGIDIDGIINIKEIRSFSLLTEKEDMPMDIFNIVCNNIIKEIENYEKIVMTTFRDIIYDILIYNLDAVECLWYILVHFIKNNQLSQKSISKILIKTYSFLKYYNNNYRPIYHLESIFYYIIILYLLHLKNQYQKYTKIYKIQKT